MQPEAMKTFPQGLKPNLFAGHCGAAEAVPFQSLIYATSSSHNLIVDARNSLLVRSG